MARAKFVKKAAKDYPEHGIAKGESYYWWKFMVGGRGGPKHYSKTPPKPSQLTQSEFLQGLRGIQEQVDALAADSELPDAVADIVQQLRDLGQEQEDKKDNLPDSLQNGPTGELLDSRKEACEQAADEFEQIDFDNDEAQKEEYWAEKLEEVQAVEMGEGG